MQRKIFTPEEVGLSSQRLERIRPVMQARAERKMPVGMSTMVSRRGKVVHFEQIGLMDVEEERAMTDDAIFRIYSMTKPIICTALMTLFEEGRFHLFDPVGKFIPAFAALKVLESDANGNSEEVDPIRPMTICDLLTHTSGLTYDFLENSAVNELYRQARLGFNVDRTLQECIQEVARMPLAFHPGTRWQYSLGIDVAACLIEILSDQPLGEFLKERFFDPLEMVDTDFGVRPDNYARMATMYGRPDIISENMTLSKLAQAWFSGFNEQIDVSQSYPASRAGHFARGGHGLFSTAWDYMRFAQMLLNFGELDGSRILGRKTVELMHTNHVHQDLLPFEIAPPAAYGYGFGLGSRVLMDVAESKMPGSVGEFGWGGAAGTYYWVDPKEDLIGLFMTQTMIQLDDFQKDFQVLVYQALLD